MSEPCLEGKRVPRTPSCDPDCEAVVLTELPVGGRGTVSCLDDPGGLDARKLAALGILPGTDLELLQRSPVFVLRIGYADLALDRTLAERIRVRRPGPDPPERPSTSPHRGPAPRAVRRSGPDR